MRNGMKICRKCGKQISIITWRAYRSVLVDPEAVDVVPDPDGEEYLRVDGSKIMALEVAFDYQGPAEPAYRPHAKTCSGGWVKL